MFGCVTGSSKSSSSILGSFSGFSVGGCHGVDAIEGVLDRMPVKGSDKVSANKRDQEALRRKVIRMPLDENDLDYIDATIKSEVAMAKTEMLVLMESLSSRINTLWTTLAILAITQMAFNFMLLRWIHTLRDAIMMIR